MGADTAEARDAIAELQSDARINLYAVLVDSFDELDKETWVQQSFTASDLGGNDILLAIAVQDRRFSFHAGVAGQSFAVSQDQVRSVLENESAPHMSAGDWSGAIVAAAQGIQAAATGSGGSGTNGASSGTSNSGGLGWIWLVIALAIAVGLFLWIRSARRKAASAAREADAPAGPPPEPYEKLSNRSVTALIATDNAVQASEAELSLAVTEFGDEATAEFRSTFKEAKAKLTQAFQLRQEIDDEIPESEDTRRGWMAQIIDLCQQASDALEAQSERFGALRDLKTRLPQVLAALPGNIDAQASRLPAAAASLERMGSMYSTEALGAVHGNTDHAHERLEFARSALAEATSTVDTSAAVLHARAAQEAVQQATRLLDAIDRLDAALRDAATTLAETQDAVAAELVEVRSALAEHNAGAAAAAITAQLDAVAQVLTASRTVAGAKDPISALEALHDADRELDTILATTRSAQQREERDRKALDGELATASTVVRTVDDFISTRRGAMATTARTRLAEAQRHLARAQALADTDAHAALGEAQQAITLARQAYAEAQDDMNRWGGGGYGGGPRMHGMGSAILGGIIGGMLAGGGRGGGWGGGFGGFGGGGFGGGGGGGFSGGGGFGGGGGGFSGGGSF